MEGITAYIIAIREMEVDLLISIGQEQVAITLNPVITDSEGTPIEMEANDIRDACDEMKVDFFDVLQLALQQAGYSNATIRYMI